MTNKDEFTEKETQRQDIVDNAIQNLMVELAPWGVDDIEWDIEYIGEIRDVIQEFLVNKLHLMTEQEFYPYRELEAEPDENGNVILEPSGFILNDQFGELSGRFEDSINGLDAQEFADFVGEFFGGTCRHIGEYKYRFIPNSDYQGGLDDIKEK